MRERYYPYLMKDFNGLLARGGDGWKSIVRGTHISILDKLLS